jgi:hypothetical protein
VGKILPSEGPKSENKMTLTRRVLKKYLLLLCLSAVLRPTKQDWTTNNHPAAGTRRSDGADGISTFRGPSFPVALLLTHFGSRDVKGIRKMRRRKTNKASLNAHQPAIHLALSHQLTTKTTPCILVLTYLLDGREVGAPSMFTSVKGVGEYLSAIYLQTIEKNPGPLMTEEERDAALSQIREVFGMVQSIRGTCDTLEVELKDIKQNFEQRFEKNEKAVQELKSESKTTQQRLNQLERQVRRKNVIIFGVPSEVAVESALQKIFVEKLELQQVPPYETAYRLGKQTEKTPILVKLREQSDKEAIMSNVSKLRGTKLVVSDDLTPEEQAVRRTIVAASKVAKAKNISCKVRRTGLLVDNQLILPAELCNPDWVNNFTRSEANSEQPPRGAGTSKRPHSSTVSPASAAAAASEDFRRPRSDSTDSLSSKAGGRPQRTLSKEDKNRDKTNKNKANK